MKKRIALFVPIIAIMLLAIATRADDKPPPVNWSASATSGAKVQVPAPAGVSVIAFVRPDQEQSRSVLRQIRSNAAQSKDVQVIVVISGAQETSPTTLPVEAWPVVVDPEFVSSGRFNVHVWPTTVIVSEAGEQLAHLAGSSDAFSADFQNYLEFAAGKIDQATLKKRLAEHEFVADDKDQKANRHVLLASRLLDAGQLDQAKAQLEEAKALRPDDPKASLLLARLLILQKQPRDALALLDKIPGGAIAAWQLQQLRARALIDVDRWDDARAAIPEALKLNPQPAEAHYLYGVILQHDGKFQQSADELRQAYELSQQSAIRSMP